MLAYTVPQFDTPSSYKAFATFTEMSSFVDTTSNHQYSTTNSLMHP